MPQLLARHESVAPVRKNFSILFPLAVRLIALWALAGSASGADIPNQYSTALRDADYSVYSGDVNSDGIVDLLFRSRNQFGFVQDDFSIPVWLRWRGNFIVLSGLGGSYTIQSNPSSMVLSDASWKAGTYELSFQNSAAGGSEDMLASPAGTNGTHFLLGSSFADGTPILRKSTASSLPTKSGGTIQKASLAGSALAIQSAAVAATVVGRSAGSFDVNSIGAATYDIPLWMPAGPNGVQPSLSIHYDSRSTSGTMGPGWEIGGLGAISRCVKTFAQDTNPAPIALSTGDGYCINGNRLRLTGGTYGAPSSTYQTELADFSQVTAYGAAGNGPAYFYAQGKDGLTYEYGNSNDGGATNTARITASGTSTPYQWQLNKVRDRSGNQYVLTYGSGQTGSVGVGVPLNISYTLTSAGASTYRYSVAFTYTTDTADGTEVRYVAGGTTSNNNLLSRIEIKRLDVVKSLRTYSFGYEASPTTIRRRLVSVQECSDTALTSCLSPTLITYQNGAAGVAATSSSALSSSTKVRGFYDFNGDGRQDILYESGTAIYVAFATLTGYGTPVSAGITLSSGDYYDADDLIGSGKDEILITRGGIWYRYFWNGSAFSGLSSGVPLATDEKVLGSSLADINGDGLPDLLTVSTTGSPAGTTLYCRLNTSSGGSLGISSTRVVAYDMGSPITKITTKKTNRSFWSNRDQLDFNGDGREDVVMTGLLAGQRMLISTGSGFQSGTSNTLYTSYLDWNDDKCTDVVTFSRNIFISACNGVTGQTLSFSETYLGTIDWNGDGRTDLLVNSGGYLGVRLSTGAGLGILVTTSVPADPNPIVFDQNGDGLEDLGSISATSPYPVTYRLHNGAGVPADLVASITDGYGIAYSPSYASIVNGSHTKGSGATYPERDVQTPIYVVSQVQASDGIGSIYTKTYSYAGARENIQGRGFSGFQSISVSDGRTNAPALKSYYKTAFPYTGLQYQRDVYQHNGTTLIARVVNTPATTTLSSTANQQRFFPYIASAAGDGYEVGGTKNGLMIRQSSVSFTYDGYGNVTASTKTLTDKDSAAPQSPTYNQSWTATVTNTVSPSTTNWCLGIPTQTTVSRSATNISAITRTTSFTPDYVKCRITQSVVEPNSATYKVTTGYGYDSFGNINSQTVTGIGMAARTSTASWGTTGQFPVSQTNALSQTSTAAYDYDRGVQTSSTDPNNLTTSWTPDAFGRIVTELRPDGTSTAYSYNNCASVVGGCQNGDPGSGATGINKLVATATVKDTGGNAMRDDWLYFDQFERPIVGKSKTLTGGYSRVGKQYDALGRLYRQTEPCVDGSCSVYWITNAYDAAGRLTTQSRPVSALDSSLQTATVSYQGMTNVMTDAESKTTTKAVDPNGWLRQSQDHDGYSQSFAYDAFGGLKTVTDSQSNSLFSASYDYGLSAFRRQTIDMDLGTWSYTPNALGEVASYIDANGSSFSLTYDKLSRPLTRTVSGEVTTWIWGSSAASYNIGQLQSLTSTGGTTESYTYDNKERVSQVQIASDATYIYNATYSGTTGLLDTLTYPTSTSSYRLKLQYGYQNGLLKQISDFNAGSTVFWQATAMNPRFQITSETLGNGIVASSGFDAVTGWLSTLQAGSGGGNGMQNEAYQYDKVGNLKQRQNLAASLTETFTYDNLYRLDYSQLNGTTNLDLSYNALGNITTRCEPTCGSAWTYHSTKKHAVTAAIVGSTTYSYGYDSNGNVTSRNGYTLTWNKHNYPTLINGLNESIALSYDASFQRWKQVLTQSGVTETTIYAGGLLEKVTSGSTTDWRHAIYANGKSVALVSRTSAGVNTARYVLEDLQGGVAKILSSSGSTTVSESFTAFGSRRNPSTWSGAPISTDLTTINGISREGFTGHTALGSLGLNHMNGRVQDALSGRFLSADPYIAEPGNTQGYNRYSYVSNNPLSFVDPSGFEGEPHADGGEICAGACGDVYDFTTNLGSEIFGAIGGVVDDVFGGLFGGGHHRRRPPPPPAQPRATDSGNIYNYDSSLGQSVSVEGGPQDFNEVIVFARPQPELSGPGLFARGGVVDRAVGRFVVGYVENVILNPAVIGAPFGGTGLSTIGRFGSGVTSVAGGPIQFAQRGVSGTFRHGEFAGQSIEQVSAALRIGAISADQLPVQVIARNGMTYTLNNRSLMALRQAGLEPTVIRNVTGDAFFEGQLTQRLSEIGTVPPGFVPRIR